MLLHGFPGLPGDANDTSGLNFIQVFSSDCQEAWRELLERTPEATTLRVKRPQELISLDSFFVPQAKSHPAWLLSQNLRSST